MDRNQTDSPKFSGPEQGEAYVTRFQAYLDGLKAAGKNLPVDARGQPIITEISRDSGIPRNSFYTNKGVKKLLLQATGVPTADSDEGGKASYYQDQLELRERRILQLEQRVANVEAEKDEVARLLAEAEQNLLRYKIIEDDVIKAGRRVIP
jgi:hypothetical protein